MPQVGSDANPVMFRQTIASKESRFRKGMNLSKYKDNYERIFSNSSVDEHDTEIKAARENSKTFSMEQD